MVKAFVFDISNVLETELGGVENKNTGVIALVNLAELQPFIPIRCCFFLKLAMMCDVEVVFDDGDYDTGDGFRHMINNTKFK